MSVQSVLQSDNFFDISRKIAKDFLQSVVVVDDQATLDEAKIEANQAESLIEPSASGSRKSSSTIETEDKEAVENSDKPEEILNVKQLNDCFAESGLVCGVLKPTETDVASLVYKVDHITRIARRADIVVFDWVLSHIEKQGATALDSISAILESDIDEIRKNTNLLARMRLIAIYTSMRDLEGIMEETKQFLGTKGLSFVQQDFVLSKDGIRIVFYRKDRGGDGYIGTEERTVGESVLVDRLIDDFTYMTYGLLSNIALASLGALRENTHRVLRKFEKKLDAAYVTHRTMVTPSEEAQQHPVPLLTAEINDVLEDYGVDVYASMEMIEKWLSYGIEKGDIVLNGKVGKLTSDQIQVAILDIVNNGIDSVYEKHKINKTLPEWKKRLEDAKSGDKDSLITSLLVNDTTANQRDMDFAILTTMRAHYERPEPMLTLGTIVEQTISEISNYYICIQPVCDSVRLKGNTVFPFLRLNDIDIPEEDGKLRYKFDIVLKDKSNYKKLKTTLKARDISLITLKHRGSEEIRAIKDRENGEEYIFETIVGEENIRWVGNLKFAHAQRIANDFAREISRVGLTESDWLRRMRPR